ncbi:EAL domain-containing protein [Fusibacter sp. 3D3]|uniref:EAL domain-containing protein n=1 Tax=Fusibacter sp. 3D3 TaxID=1048380 RepID=UPI000852BF00|nr:EAL domain-containing protein [Fusibacter sp. 3D3]GAU77945.1 diguanylate cyclase/phosphodiesterase [Fusibacter sp. 3D3]
MVLEITLVMITFSIITYIAIGIKSAYKGRDPFKDFFTFGYSWQIIATIVCYLMFYPKIACYIQQQWLVSLLLNGILFSAIFSYVRYVRQSRIEKKYIASVLSIILSLNALMFIPVAFKKIDTSQLLILGSFIFFVFFTILYFFRDYRQKNLAFVQMFVGGVVFLSAAIIRQNEIDYYLVGISNAALFLIAFGIIFYYMEYSHLKLSDSKLNYKNESEKYKRLSEKYDIAMKAVQEGIWEYEYENDIFHITESMAALLGIKEGILVNALKTIRSKIHVEDLAKWEGFASANHTELVAFIKKSSAYKAEMEYRIEFPDGVYRWVRQKVSIQRDEQSGKQSVFGVLSVIQEVKEAQHEIYKLAYVDGLTELKNFTSLRLELDKMTRAHVDKAFPKIRLILLDIDRFKYINDIRGHQFGDLVLAKVAQELIKSQDQVYRVSGTEFMIIQKIDNVVSGSEVIFKYFEKPFNINRSDIYLSVSMGILEGPDLNKCKHSDELLMKLDLAKNRAKELGGGCFVTFDDTLIETISEKVKISEALRGAILNNELVMFYQPQLDLISQEIVGYEALLRWTLNNQEIAPGTIIEIAEETGQISALGDHIIEMVFRDFKLLGPHMKVAINLSVLQLEDTRFLTQVEALREKYQVDPSRVYFEITENIWIKSQQEKISVLNLLRDKGYKISLDDFGTGYSSYSYIESLPLDELKLDMSFTKKMMTSEKHKQMTINIIQLGKIFNLSVICEGIETEEALKFLTLNGCDIGQGYLISKPKAIADLRS